MNTSNSDRPKPGETLHFLATGLAYAESTFGVAGTVSRRGQELTVTEDLIKAGTNRNGKCWLDLLNQPERQSEKFGRVAFAPGPFPPNLLRTEPGSTEHAEARAEARREALGIQDQKEREAALRKVDAVYGPSAPTSHTLARYDS